MSSTQNLDADDNDVTTRVTQGETGPVNITTAVASSKEDLTTPDQMLLRDATAITNHKYLMCTRPIESRDASEEVLSSGDENHHLASRRQDLSSRILP